LIAEKEENFKMRLSFYGAIVTAAVTLGIMTLAPAPAGAQDQRKGYKAPTGPAPKMPDGKPDFSGVWQPPRMADVTQDTFCCKGVPQLPYTAYGKERWEAYDASKGDYAGSCLPFGLLRSVGGPHPVQVMQSAKYFAELWEQNTWFHVTPIGKPHSKDPSPTWFGESVARWEGDNLIIDTIAFNGKTRIDTIGHPHSDQLHTIEKLNRSSLGIIDYVITIDDPKVFTKPWDSVRKWFLHPDWEIMEYACEENNKDLQEGHIAPGINP
jgi:hypothetical protein